MASQPPKKPRPVKGILKKPKSANANANSSGTPPQDVEAMMEAAEAAAEAERARKEAEQTALRHAAIIQERKDLDMVILNSIVRLTDFPLVRGPAHSSASPAPSDVAEFKSLVRIFQPGDYDDLIVERNTCGLCGYALCPNPRRTFPGAGTWKLINAGRKDFGIVEKKELEKWCSLQCARRAMYVKVQLNETAAWERVGIPDIQIDLLDEEQRETTAEGQLARELGKLRLDEERKQAKDSAVLALERGDAGELQRAKNVDIGIVEKTTSTVPTAPSQPAQEEAETGADDTHLLLEGHRTKFGSGPSKTPTAPRATGEGMDLDMRQAWA